MVGDPRPIAVAASRIFAKLKIPYLLGGSVASTLHGEPRATLDADFAVHLEPDLAKEVASLLSKEFYVDELSVVEAAEFKRMFNAIHSKAFIKVDVHVREASGHSASEMERAIEVELASGDRVRVATPEDTALRKLWWYRKGDEASDRQWKDVLGVLKQSGLSLDTDYMTSWASELDVADLLERALEESR